MFSARANHDFLFKFVIVGDTGVGKTALIRRFSRDEFDKGDKSTIGVDLEIIKSIEVENKKIQLELWDTAGKERFRQVTLGYYRNSHAVFLVYDITNLDSFNNLDAWFKEAKVECAENTCFVLVGTKSHSQDKKVSLEQAKQKAANLKLDPNLCFEVSAETETRESVDAMFTAVIKKAYDLLPAEEKKKVIPPKEKKKTNPPKDFADNILSKRTPSYFQRNKEQIIGGLVAAAIFTIVAVVLGVMFWPAIVALVPVGAGIAIGAALGIPALTAATALAATVFTGVSAAIVAGLSAFIGKFGINNKAHYQQNSPIWLIDSNGHAESLSFGGSNARITSAIGGDLEEESREEDVSYESTEEENNGEEPDALDTPASESTEEENSGEEPDTLDTPASDGPGGPAKR